MSRIIWDYKAVKVAAGLAGMLNFTPLNALIVAILMSLKNSLLVGFNSQVQR